MLSAVSGSPPIANTSDSAFAAATRPNVYGSSTMGAKKSTVWTSAMSSVMRKTAASSNVSRPTSNRGSSTAGSGASARARSPGPIFDAHPAHRANSVSRTTSATCSGRIGIRAAVPTAAGDPPFRRLPTDGRDGIDLDQYPAGQRTDLDRRTCRPGSAHRARIHLVHGGIVAHVPEIHRCLDDVAPAGTRRLAGSRQGS